MRGASKGGVAGIEVTIKRSVSPASLEDLAATGSLQAHAEAGHPGTFPGCTQQYVWCQGQATTRGAGNRWETCQRVDPGNCL